MRLTAPFILTFLVCSSGYGFEECPEDDDPIEKPLPVAPSHWPPHLDGATVTTQFTVNKDGTVSDVSVAKYTSAIFITPASKASQKLIYKSRNEPCRATWTIQYVWEE